MRYHLQFTNLVRFILSSMVCSSCLQFQYLGNHATILKTHVFTYQKSEEYNEVSEVKTELAKLPLFEVIISIHCASLIKLLAFSEYLQEARKISIPMALFTGLSLKQWTILFKIQSYTYLWLYLFMAQSLSCFESTVSSISLPFQTAEDQLLSIQQALLQCLTNFSKYCLFDRCFLANLFSYWFLDLSWTKYLNFHYLHIFLLSRFKLHKEHANCLSRLQCLYSVATQVSIDYL